jgi:hypothetical protein
LVRRNAGAEISFEMAASAFAEPIEMEGGVIQVPRSPPLKVYTIGFKKRIVSAMEAAARAGLTGRSASG